MTHSLELLAPAGSPEAFVAAVENGADAVYLGGRNHNARQSAPNFGDDDLRQAIRYAHVRGVQVYLTLNTLLTGNELSGALDQAILAYKYDVDAIIVQDLGLAALLRRAMPALDLHASTQMTIYSAEGLQSLAEMGFKRVVLAREISLGEIETINAARTGVETEIFVHGAHCLSYSGVCLFSASMGPRSGNRGTCAQPCRLPWRLEKPGERETLSHILSPKDLCLAGEIDRIKASGVSAVKIEGRLKTPEYVAVVTGIYRRLIDGEPYTESDAKALAQIFNRGGFTGGHFKGVKAGSGFVFEEKPKNQGIQAGRVVGYDRNRRILTARLTEEVSVGDGIEIWNGSDPAPGCVVSWSKTLPGGLSELGDIKGDINAGDPIFRTSSKSQLQAARETWRGAGSRKVGVSGVFKAFTGRPASLTVRDSSRHSVTVTSAEPVAAAEKTPTAPEQIRAQLSKTGDTPFRFNNIEVFSDGSGAMPASALNAMRRDALTQLEELRAEPPGRPEPLPADIAALVSKMSVKPALSVCFHDYDHMSELLSEGLLRRRGAARVYVPYDKRLAGSIQNIREAADGAEIYVRLPVALKVPAGAIAQAAEGADGLACSVISQIRFTAAVGLKLHAENSMNIMNGESARVLADLGFSGFMPAHELSAAESEEIPIPPGMTLEARVWGKFPVMTSEYCIIGKGKRCKRYGRECARSHIFKMTGRGEKAFDVVADCEGGCVSRIYAEFSAAAPRNAALLRLDVLDQPAEEITRALDDIRRKGRA